jgi:ABC-type sugar transport system substrate-binding protein
MMVKSFCFLVIALLLFASVACATTVTFAWDSKPADQDWSLVRIYERIGAAEPYNYIKVAEVVGDFTQASASIVSGVHTFIARSVAADGILESNDSNAVTATIKPGAPTNLKFTIP